jgi:hypothetical protein
MGIRRSYQFNITTVHGIPSAWPVPGEADIAARPGGWGSAAIRSSGC